MCREIKTGMRIMLYFMQFQLILPICNFCSKVKTQKSQTHNSKDLIQNTMSHIGFRNSYIVVSLGKVFIHFEH